MEEFRIDEITVAEIEREKETHQFEELTNKIIGELRSYLKATGLKVGLLLNFSKPTLEIRRVVN